MLGFGIVFFSEVFSTSAVMEPCGLCAGLCFVDGRVVYWLQCHNGSYQANSA